MRPAPTRGSKPGERRGGRKAGVPNKTTKAIKDMILGALDKAHADGGEAYLIEQSEKNPVAFMGLVAKVLPMQITGEDGAAINVAVTRVELVGPSDHG